MVLVFIGGIAMTPYGYQGFNNYPQMQNNPYLQQGYNPYVQNNLQMCDVISGSIVDSEDVVRSKNCALDGSPTYYPLADQSAIFVKKLNPQNGSGMVLKYALEIPKQEQETSVEQQVASLLSSFKNELSKEISDLKSVVLSHPQPKDQVRPRNGGDK